MLLRVPWLIPRMVYKLEYSLSVRQDKSTHTHTHTLSNNGLQTEFFRVIGCFTCKPDSNSKTRNVHEYDIVLVNSVSKGERFCLDEGGKIR